MKYDGAWVFIVRCYLVADVVGVMKAELDAPRGRHLQLGPILGAYAAAACGPPSWDGGARMRSCADLARRPLGAAVARDGNGIAWPRLLLGGPMPWAVVVLTKIGLVLSKGVRDAVRSHAERGGDVVAVRADG